MIQIVLPAYNEEENLPALLQEIRDVMEEARLTYRVIVVNDGSADGTPRIAAAAALEMPVALVDHAGNRGLAETLRTGLLEALKTANPKDIIVTMDADNTHPPGLIVRMARMIREGHDVVIASRFRKGARVLGVPRGRRALSSGAGLFFRLLFPIPGVRDYTSGYRAYRVPLLRDLFESYGDGFIDQRGFSCMVDVLLKIRRTPAVIGEAPLILRYHQKRGMSKMKVGATLGDTLKLAWVRFREDRRRA